MSYLSDLKTARDNLASELATESANPKPTYSVDGRSWDWAGYRAQLTKQIADLNKLIVKAGGNQASTRVMG